MSKVHRDYASRWIIARDFNVIGVQEERLVKQLSIVQRVKQAKSAAQL